MKSCTYACGTKLEMHLAALAASATLMIGCGVSTDTVDGASAESAVSASTEAAAPVAKLHTDRGNELAVDFVVDPPTGAGFASPSLIITYRDTKNEFGRAAAIDASVVVHKSDGSHVERSIGLTNGAGPHPGVVSYDGIFTVGDTLIASIDVVVSHQGKRDPAGTKTYRLSFDHSDTHCAVVLRDVAAPDFSRSPSGPSFAWSGTIDVATSKLEGSAVGIQWRSSFSDAPSSELVSKRIPGAPAGFQRFAFQLTRNTFPANGQDTTALRMFQMSVIPFLNLADGTRVFDHNRVADRTSYVLWSGDTAGGLVPAPPNAQIGKAFAVHDDASICKAGHGH